MKKLLSIVAMFLIVACGGQTMQPSAPEQTETPKAASNEMVIHYGDTWSVSFPSEFKVDDTASNSMTVKANNDGGDALMFMKAAGNDNNDKVFAGLYEMFLSKGMKPHFIGDGKVSDFPAKEMVYSMDKGVVAIVFFTTGSNVYMLLYRGKASRESGEMFNSVVGTIQVKDVPVVVPTTK